MINAIVYWNTLYLEPAFAELNREGVATPPDVIKTHHPARVAAYQSHRRLYLDPDGQRRSQATAARNIHPRSVITLLKSRTASPLSCRDA